MHGGGASVSTRRPFRSWRAEGASSCPAVPGAAGGFAPRCPARPAGSPRGARRGRRVRSPRCPARPAGSPHGARRSRRVRSARSLCGAGVVVPPLRAPPPVRSGVPGRAFGVSPAVRPCALPSLTCALCSREALSAVHAAQVIGVGPGRGPWAIAARIPGALCPFLDDFRLVVARGAVRRARGASHRGPAVGGSRAPRPCAVRSLIADLRLKLARSALRRARGASHRGGAGLWAVAARIPGAVCSLLDDFRLVLARGALRRARGASHRGGAGPWAVAARRGPVPCAHSTLTFTLWSREAP